MFTGASVIPPGEVDPINEDGALITKVEFDDEAGAGTTNYIAPFGQARANLDSTNIPEMGPGSGYPSIGTVLVKSFDLTDTSIFTPQLPIDEDFPNSNTFAVSEAFGNFVEVDGRADAETPDLAIKLLNLTSSQSQSLLVNQAEIGVGFTGDVQFLTFGPDGQEMVLGTGSFSSTIPANGTNVVEGTGVLSFEVGEQIPESSTVSALIGFGLVGSAFALKRKVRSN